jgi:S-adenosylmethionine hydrolase
VSAARPIIFLSDYGHLDEFVGVCHAVIARRAPSARVIDLTHAIPRHDVRSGASVLGAAIPFLPAGVHLAVVDPDVGATGEHARRAVAIETAQEGHLLVGPDNGLLIPAAARLRGALQAVDIGCSRERLTPVSRTFHGRDIFAPVAAALAAGEPLSAVGEPLAPGELQPLALPSARVADGALLARVLRVDGFGNVILDAQVEQLAELGVREGEAVSVHHGGEVRTALFAATFAQAPAGELLIYDDAQQMLALAVNRGSAAVLLDARRDDELVLRPA